MANKPNIITVLLTGIQVFTGYNEQTYVWTVAHVFGWLLVLTESILKRS